MKVYVTYEKDGYGGQQVEKVFINKHNAVSFVVESRLKDNGAFRDKTESELRALAENHIEEHPLIEIDRKY